jgi:hypothetical protein
VLADGREHLLCAASRKLSSAALLRERGAMHAVVDVSEFLKGGGGSVKCMFSDLGRCATIASPGASGPYRRLTALGPRR